MKIKMTDITQIVNWHTGGKISDISLSLILRTVECNDCHPNKPRFAACDLLNYKGVSPSVNPSVTFCFSPFAKGTTTLTQGRTFAFYEDLCVNPARSLTASPQGFAGVYKGKLLCLFKRTKSPILWDVDNPKSEGPFSSANNKLRRNS